MSRSAELRTQLSNLDGLIASGVLAADAARQARATLEARLVQAQLQEGDAPARPAPRLVLALSAFVLVFAVAGYAWLGNREGLAVAPGMAGALATTEASHDVTPAQMAELTERLAERMKSRPDDVVGWTMLARSYSVLGRHQDAVPAYQRVIALSPKDAQAYADYADTLAMANGRKLAGEPEKLIAKALELDPDNAKALSLAGTVAFDRGEAAQAARYWEHALRSVEPGSEMATRLQGAVDEARQRAGLPAQPKGAMAAATQQLAATTAAPAPAAADAKAAAAAAVQLRVALAPALRSRAAPEDTVFIFARAVAGPKAPLAIQRRQVKDLPLELTLDDSMAMSPALRLSTVKQVIIGARISKSGNAMPQSGDLQGLSGTIAVGSRGLSLEIAEILP